MGHLCHIGDDIHDTHGNGVRWRWQLLELAGMQLDDLDGQCDPGDDVVVVGDYNICPADIDCWDPKKFETATHTSQAERDRLAALEQWGLVDVFREHHPEERLYSWWDYRGGSFYKKMGLRIDLLMTSRSVTDATTLALIDRNERKGPKDDPPSDHAPVFIDVER